MLFSFLIMFGFVQNAIGADRVYLDITASETRKINIAVPWFQNKDLSRPTTGDRQRTGRYLGQSIGFSWYYFHNSHH